MVSWSATSTIANAGDPSVLALTVNGTPDGNATSSAEADVGNTVTLSGTTIVTAGASTNLTLRNTGTNTTQYENVSITIIKLS